MGKLIEDPALRNQVYVFKGREEAGKFLARKLADHTSADTLILAIPAGGVPVASEMARELKLPMDLMIVRKIQIPGDTEAGFGAIGPDGEIIFNEPLLKKLRLSSEEVQKQAETAREVVAARNQLYRNGRPFPEVKDKPILLVDDGLASGFSMMEAVKFLRKREARKITVAVPTAPQDSVNGILPLADEVFCLNVRTQLPFAVANAYENWYDLTDENVLSLLRDSGRE